MYLGVKVFPTAHPGGACGGEVVCFVLYPNFDSGDMYSSRDRDATPRSLVAPPPYVRSLAAPSYVVLSSSSSSGTLAYRSLASFSGVRFIGETCTSFVPSASVGTNGASPASPGSHRTRATYRANGAVPGMVTQSYTAGLPGTALIPGGYIANTKDRSGPEVTFRLKPP